MNETEIRAIGLSVRKCAPAKLFCDLEESRRLEGMLELRPEDVFSVNPNIRWAGMATKKGQVIFSQMRPGIQTLTPEEDDRLLLELRSQFLVDMSERTGRWAGPLQYIAICYEKFIELTTVLKDKYVVVTVERSVPAQTLVDVTKSIQNLEK